MFNNLVESTSSAQQNGKRSAYLGATAIVNGALFLTIFVWSLYSFDLSILSQNEDFNVNMIVAPTTIPDKVLSPPKPLDSVSSKPAASKYAPVNYDKVKDPVESINNSTKPPKTISVVKTNANQVHNNVRFIVSDAAECRAEFDPGNPPPRGDAQSESAAALSLQKSEFTDEPDKAAPKLTPASKPIQKAANKTTIVSKGVINGTAKFLPKPAYPIQAKAVRAGGAVKVQVTIDETGSVISASTVEGHPLLRAAAVEAAKQAKFRPTTLSDQPVKVTGVIVYNFVQQ